MNKHSYRFLGYLRDIFAILMIPVSLAIVTWVTSTFESPVLASPDFNLGMKHNEEVTFGNELRLEFQRINYIDIFVFDYKETAEFIAKYEGFRHECYEDGNHYSIGFGFACREREYMSKNEAVRILHVEVKRIEAMLPRGMYSQNQKTALISLMYNAPGLQRNPHFLQDLSEKDMDELEYYFKNRTKVWHNGSRVVLRGLVKRRNEELTLFLT